MPTLLAISPHLDDAVFSAGGTLAQRAHEGWNVIIATCFTGNVSKAQGFALACQLDKGIAADIDYMALRRAEDREACRFLGATTVHLALLEAPHRGYQDVKALFGSRLALDEVKMQLQGELARLVEYFHPDAIFAPAAIGNHVDHWVVRDCVAELIRQGLLVSSSVRLWSDWPYVDKVTKFSDTLSEIMPITNRDIALKIAASSAYVSQIGFQFGSLEAMKDRIAGIRTETFWHVN